MKQEIQTNIYFNHVLFVSYSIKLPIDCYFCFPAVMIVELVAVSIHKSYYTITPLLIITQQL